MNLLDFQSILDASTPDGRWNLLQDFLKRNPEWKEKADRWLTLDPDTAVFQLEADLAERLNIPIAVFRAVVLNVEIKQKVRATIESLQTLYRERQNNQSEKETKNVRAKRTVKIGPSRRNPKRTDQT